MTSIISTYRSFLPFLVLIIPCSSIEYGGLFQLWTELLPVVCYSGSHKCHGFITMTTPSLLCRLCYGYCQIKHSHLFTKLLYSPLNYRPVSLTSICCKTMKRINSCWVIVMFLTVLICIVLPGYFFFPKSVCSDMKWTEMTVIASNSGLKWYF